MILGVWTEGWVRLLDFEREARAFGRAIERGLGFVCSSSGSALHMTEIRNAGSPSDRRTVPLTGIIEHSSDLAQAFGNKSWQPVMDAAERPCQSGS